MATAPQKPLSVPKVVEADGKTILDQVIDTGIRPRDQSERDHAERLVRTLVSELLDPGMVVSPNVTRTIRERIAVIDQILSDQVNAILHHPAYQKLEASWRGLAKLVKSAETGENMKVRVLFASKKELRHDFSTATEFTESALWRKVYAQEYSQYGGDPYGALVGDFEFDKGAQDMELLKHLSQVAAGSHAPFIAAAGAGMFGMQSFAQMPDPRDVAKIFDKANPDNAKWLSFRDTEDSRYVSLCLPHVLMRMPYGRDNPADTFDFVEDVDGESHDKYLWGNAAYAFATRLTDAFAKYRWCVAIRGPENGGMVEDLPIHTFKSREGEQGAKCPTEVLIDDDRENELSNLGFIPLLHCKNTDYAAFFGANSVQRPKKYDDPDATANAKLSSQLPYLMVTSRIAHYLKAIGRDKIGTAMSRTEVEAYLNRWIGNYVLLQDSATDKQKAEAPLREARVEVVEDRARPGCYQAIAHLRPHFQLEELNVSLRLVAALPPGKK